MQKRSLQSVLLLIAGATGLLLPLIIPCAPAETFAEQPSALPEQRLVVRSVREVTYTLPKLETTRRIFTRAELLRGRMMLLDETHPLPEDAPAPNTASIARTANGSVPVRSLDVKTGRQTIAALAELFAQLRAVKADGIFVSGGAVTPVQQRQAYVDAMRGNMRAYPPDAAAAITAQTMEMPGSGERLQEYAVELAMMQPADGNAPPEDTPAGQLLLRYAWRYGFVRTSRQQPWRFRYAGKAHAAAMTYLDLDLCDYLDWLHQKGQLVICDGDRPVYLILCVPLSGDYAAFDLPVNSTFEVSLDNTGYALAACTLPKQENAEGASK